MATKLFSRILSNSRLSVFLDGPNKVPWRSVVSRESGAFCPRPKQVPLGLFRVIFTVVPGLLVGASISRSIANFLEENDLFVPSDDDDDDD